MLIKIKLLEGGKMPEKKTAGAAAWDCFAREDVVVGSEPVLIGLGFMAEPPEGYYLEIVPRSSVGLKTNLRQPNSVGIIDPDYRGEVKAMYECKRNVCMPTYPGERRFVDGYTVENTRHFIKAGERVAQMILRKMEDAELVEVVNLFETVRGAGGFGSTGR